MINKQYVGKMHKSHYFDHINNIIYFVFKQKQSESKAKNVNTSDRPRIRTIRQVDNSSNQSKLRNAKIFYIIRNILNTQKDVKIYEEHAHIIFVWF